MPRPLADGTDRYRPGQVLVDDRVVQHVTGTGDGAIADVSPCRRVRRVRQLRDEVLQHRGEPAPVGAAVTVIVQYADRLAARGVADDQADARMGATDIGGQKRPIPGRAPTSPTRRTTDESAAGRRPRTVALRLRWLATSPTVFSRIRTCPEPGGESVAAPHRAVPSGVWIQNDNVVNRGRHKSRRSPDAVPQHSCRDTHANSLELTAIFALSKSS